MELIGAAAVTGILSIIGLMVRGQRHNSRDHGVSIQKLDDLAIDLRELRADVRELKAETREQSHRLTRLEHS